MKKLNSKNKFSLKEKGFYEQLPRFVIEPATGNGECLPALKRTIEWNGRELVLTIVPACAITHSPRGVNFGRRSIFPGADEAQLEKALRRLTVESNINFDAENSVLCFSFTEMRNIYEDVTNSSILTITQLEKSLFILFDSNYILKLGTREYYFRAIDRIKWVDQEEEKYYRVGFTPLFFDHGELFSRIFKDLTAKNP